VVKEKRLSLTVGALGDGVDEECLVIMAREFGRQKGGWMNHVYWHGLDLEEATNDVQESSTDHIGEDIGGEGAVM
jgi:hypothetical protein